jgi:hypothetical protein
VQRRFQSSVVLTNSFDLCAKVCYDSSKNLGPSIPPLDNHHPGFQFRTCISQSFLFYSRIINTVLNSGFLPAFNKTAASTPGSPLFSYLSCLPTSGNLPRILSAMDYRRTPPWAARSPIRPCHGPGPWIFTTSDFVITIAWRNQTVLETQ